MGVAGGRGTRGGVEAQRVREELHLLHEPPDDLSANGVLFVTARDSFWILASRRSKTPDSSKQKYVVYVGKAGILWCHV